MLSLPFHSHELLSWVRSQLQDKSVADRFRERVRLADENRNTTQQVVTAVNDKRRMLREGGLAAIALVAAAALVFFLLYRHNQQQSTRVYAATRTCRRPYSGHRSPYPFLMANSFYVRGSKSSIGNAPCAAVSALSL